MKKDYKIFVILNIAVPLIIGAVIYYFLSSDVIFVKIIDKILKVEIHFTELVETSFVIRFVRFYDLDMLWGYALVFALHFIYGNNEAGIRKIFIIAVIFTIIMEVFQLICPSAGTFDLYDILCEALAEILAIFIIKNAHKEI